MPMSKLPSTRPISISDREFSQLYLELASECFNKATATEQADRAEILRRMGRRYVAEAAALDRSLGGWRSLMSANSITGHRRPERRHRESSRQGSAL
jgi:hypothetical protein